MAQTRKRPAGNRPSPQHRANGYPDSSLHRPEDGCQAPIAQERREAELLDELRSLGYAIAIRCRVCGHPLTTAASVAAHIGPKCAAKAVAE